MGHFLGGLSDQGIITEILGQFLIYIISKRVSVIILTYMHGGLNLSGAKIPSHETFSRGSDQGIITEILGQFLIFIISKCVSVIILTYMHVTFGGLIPSHGAFSRGSV